jgi:hypothetical protein
MNRRKKWVIIKYIYVCSLQDIRWPGKENAIKNNYMILNREHKSDTYEFGSGFYFTRHIMDNLLDFKTVNDRICKIRFKLKYYTLTWISTPLQLKKKEKDE